MRVNADIHAVNSEIVAISLIPFFVNPHNRISGIALPGGAHPCGGSSRFSANKKSGSRVSDAFCNTKAVKKF